MPYTVEQLEALKNADVESQRALFDRMSDQEKSDLAQAVTAYNSRKQTGAKPQQPKKSMWQQVRDIPIDPSMSRVGTTLGIDTLTPTVGNVAQGAKRVWESIGQGLLKVPTWAHLATPAGGLALAAKAVVPDIEQKKADAYSRLTQAIREDEARYQQEQKPNWLGETAGGLLAAPLPGAGGAGGTLARLGAAALRGGAEAAVMSPATSEDFWKEKIAQASLGAGTAGAIQGAGQLVGGAVKRLLPLLRRAEEVRAATGATPMLSDVSKSQFLKGAENAAEIVPFGGVIPKRLEQAGQMATKLESFREHSAGGPLEVVKSARRALAEKKRAYGEPYEFVRDVIDNSPTKPNFDNALAGADSALAQLDMPRLNKPTISIINDVKADIQGLMSSGKPVTFDAFKKVEQSLGNAGSKAQQAGDLETARILFGIKRQVRMDKLSAADAADPTGFTKQVMQKADADWAKRVARFDPFQSEAPAYAKATLKSLHGDEEFAADTVNKMLNTKSQNLPRFIGETLDEPGKAAIRSHILDSIVQESTAGKTGMSPLKLQKAIKDREVWIKEMFPEEKAQDLLGFAKAASALERAGQVLEQQGTGWGGMKMGMLGDLAKAGGASAIPLVGPIKVLGAISGTRAYLALTATKPGQSFLRKMALVGDPGGKFAQSVIKADLPKAIAAAVATGNFPELEKATSRDNNEQNQENE